MLRRLGLWCHQRRRVVVALWIVALVAIALSAGSVGSSYSQGVEVGGTESQRAGDVLRSRFAAMAGDVGQVVIASDDDVRAPVVEASVGELLRHVGGVQGVRDVTSPYEPSGVGQVSRDGKVGFATIQFDRGVSEIAPSTIERITGLVARFDRSRADESGLRVELGGRMFQEAPEVGASEIIGILAAIVILLIAFGSVLAMGLPIAIALFGIGVGAGLVALLSQVVTTPDLTTQLAAMIGIGVGIDYALFIVTRYREALACGDGPAVAVATAIDTAGRAVLFAGGTVMISILGLFIMGVDFVNGMALGVSVTVAAVMVASVTLLPALLGFLGAGIDRFSIRRVRTAASSARGNVWVRWSQFVQRHAVFAALAGLSILLVCAIPVLSMRLAFPDDGANPRSDTTRRAYDLIAEGFGVGFNGPLVLVAKLPNADDAGVVGALAEELAKTPGVAFVGPPVMSPGGDAAVLQIIPTSAPQSVQTEALVHTVRDRIVPDVVAGSGVQVSVGGITAASIDVAEKLSRRLPWFIGGVLVLSFLLLMAVFRSLLVPLKAVIMNLLATGAAYGFVVALFQWGWLSDIVGIDKTGPIAPFIPMMMFAILFGLSMDYEVFLLSRICEEYGATHDNSTAVAHGLAGTARVITAAALIMVTVFASFAFPDNPMVKLFGLGLAFAIAIDATVIRLVLVPSTMELLGDRNWWFPRWLDRVVPEVHVDGRVGVIEPDLEVNHVAM